MYILIEVITWYFSVVVLRNVVI